MSIDDHAHNEHGSHEEKSPNSMYQDILGAGAGGAAGIGAYYYLTASVTTTALIGAVGVAVLGAYVITKLAVDYFSAKKDAHDNHGQHSANGH